MRNGGLPPAHLSSSPLYDTAVPPAVNAAIVAAFVSALKSSLAAIAAMSAEKALAEEKCCHEGAAQEEALADEANGQRQAAALEKALANEANKRHRAATQEKALADEANKQCRPATQDIALANKANKQPPHESAKCAMTLATKALAKDEYDKYDDYVARWIEAYAAPFFACVDAIMAKI
jgi:hypothetical protein